MGFHICEYCRTDDEGTFSNLSSGDVTLTFNTGRVYEMPDMILHYIADHKWMPPQEFIHDVMNATLVGGNRRQTRGFVQPAKIGYLSGPFETGQVPDGFVERLETLMKQAEQAGDRMQTKGLDLFS